MKRRSDRAGAIYTGKRPTGSRAIVKVFAVTGTMSLQIQSSTVRRLFDDFDRSSTRRSPSLSIALQHELQFGAEIEKFAALSQLEHVGSTTRSILLSHRVKLQFSDSFCFLRVRSGQLSLYAISGFILFQHVHYFLANDLNRTSIGS